MLSVFLEVNTLTSEQLYGVGGVSVARDVEITEIEFPDETVGRAQMRKIAMGVGESEADLDEIQSVDVGLKNVVMMRRAALISVGRIVRRAEDETREFGVH